VTAKAARPRPVADVPQPTREAILDTAERLFSARGVDGVAVRALAQELGLSPSSLYNHFPGKQALYEAVLERGLRPIVEMIGAQDRRAPVTRERVAAAVDVLVAHLGEHPHLPRLLQRALIEETVGVRDLIETWVGPLSRSGLEVVSELAPESGWEPDEVPHVALGLFGLVFGYFLNAEVLSRLGGWDADVMAPQQLAAQRRFLERAILRMLSPRIGQRTKRRTENGHS